MDALCLDGRTFFREDFHDTSIGLSWGGWILRYATGISVETATERPWREGKHSVSIRKPIYNNSSSGLPLGLPWVLPWKHSGSMGLPWDSRGTYMKIQCFHGDLQRTSGAFSWKYIASTVLPWGRQNHRMGASMMLPWDCHGISMEAQRFHEELYCAFAILPWDFHGSPMLPWCVHGASSSHGIS